MLLLILYILNSKNIALIVAGGNGSRMKTDIAKQFLPFAESTILMQTMHRFFDFDSTILICVVLPKQEIAYWQQLCVDFNFSIPHTIVAGGNTRFQSVRIGIMSFDFENAYIAIHDGVRPLISTKIIAKSFETAKDIGNAIVAVKPKDSMRKTINSNETIAVNRADYFLVQTPQVFRLEDLKKVYSCVEMPHFTDDASVFESQGYKINIIEGNYDNIKITTPEDLVVANELLKMQNITQ